MIKWLFCCIYELLVQCSFLFQNKNATCMPMFCDLHLLKVLFFNFRPQLHRIRALAPWFVARGRGCGCTRAWDPWCWHQQCSYSGKASWLQCNLYLLLQYLQKALEQLQHWMSGHIFGMCRDNPDNALSSSTKIQHSFRYFLWCLLLFSLAFKQKLPLHEKFANDTWHVICIFSNGPKYSWELLPWNEISSFSIVPNNSSPSMKMISALKKSEFFHFPV